MTWESAPFVTLPSGRVIRGRGLRRAMPTGHLPHFGVYLLGKPAPPVPWDHTWLRWPDFRLPTDAAAAAAVFREAWERAATSRVEIACGGGIGRTGTALACIAILDGIPPDSAVDWVREHYHRRAVETPWQRRYVRNFS